METVKVKKVKTNAFVVPVGGRFVCMANGARVGTSKNPHHFEYQYKLNHVVSKKLEGIEIEKFVYVSESGTVEHIHDMSVKVNEDMLRTLKHDAKAFVRKLHSELSQKHIEPLKQVQ